MSQQVSIGSSSRETGVALGKSVVTSEGMIAMSMTYVDGMVHGPKGEHGLCLLVDTGAMYTLLPPEAWKKIGLEPKRLQAFTLADGTQITRSVSECYLVVPQGEAHTPVILGEPGDQPLLGSLTLEILGLMMNPFTRELQPLRMMLATLH